MQWRQNDGSRKNRSTRNRSWPMQSLLPSSRLRGPQAHRGHEVHALRGVNRLRPALCESARRRADARGLSEREARPGVVGPQKSMSAAMARSVKQRVRGQHVAAWPQLDLHQGRHSKRFRLALQRPSRSSSRDPLVDQFAVTGGLTGARRGHPSQGRARARSANP